jgi:hypothetical protein
MAVSAATGVFGQLRRMGVPPQLVAREGPDQDELRAGRLLLAAVPHHAAKIKKSK